MNVFRLAVVLFTFHVTGAELAPSKLWETFNILEFRIQWF